MKLLRQKVYSEGFGFTKKITEKLDKEGLTDYLVSSRIPNDSVSVNLNLKKTEIYIPDDMWDEFALDVVELDFFIKKLVPLGRLDNNVERDLHILKVNRELNEEQYLKLVGRLIEKFGFITFIDTNK